MYDYAAGNLSSQKHKVEVFDITACIVSHCISSLMSGEKAIY
jgi:hypothetical protein